MEHQRVKLTHKKKKITEIAPHGNTSSTLYDPTQWPVTQGTLCPKTVDSPNTVLQKITGGIFCTQFVQCNDGGAGDKCMFLSVFTYSSNPLTQICEIVQLTRWAHRKFPQHFLPSSRPKKHGECLLLLLACKFSRSQHVNLKLWLFHVIGVKRYREAESVHWGSETVYVSSPAKLHDVFEFQHSGWFPPPAPKRPLWHRRVETFDKVFAFVWTVLLVTLAVCVTCAVCEIVFAEAIDHRSRFKMIHHRPTVYTYRPVMLS